MYTENIEQIMEKVKEFSTIYAPFLIEEKIPLKTYIDENTGSKAVPDSPKGMREIFAGETWGKQFSYSWFYSEFEAGKEVNGKNLWLASENGAVENLVYINGRAVGLFDNIAAERCFPYVHRYQRFVLLTHRAKPGERYRIALEGYASHVIPGCYPLDSAQTFGMNGVYEKNIFNGLYIAVKNLAVASFLNNMQIFTELYENTEDRFLKGELQKCGESLFAILSRCPKKEEIAKPLERANEVLEKCLFRKDKCAKDNCFIGMIGHSHLDTAWLWNTEETRHKFARTMSNAVTLLKEFEEYRFFSSSVVHYRWLKEDYPELFEEVKKLVQCGKIEPNGASYVECDANMTGAESFVRQFVRGTKLLKEYFGYTPDTFWLPDTFGYTGSLPQILCGVGIKNFLTTKLSWNERNKVPHDTFRWVGTDQKSSVLVHLNTMGDWGSPQYILREQRNISTPRAAGRGLHAYGFGDGGGGPHREMVEIAVKMKDTVGLPETAHVLVSDFMKGFREEDLPTVFGELYLELHRGTYTSMHEIKRSNRKLEIALSNAELSYATDKQKWNEKEETDRLYDILLVNQFHDILPGSSINDVNVTAVRQNYAAIGKAQDILRANLPKGKRLFNPHSFAVKTPFIAETEEDFAWAYSNFLGEKNICVSQKLAPYGTAETLPPEQGEIVFSNNVLKTPLLEVTFNANMEIVSLIDRENGRECAEGTLNRIAMYENMPLKFDNWDIDADLPKKELCTAVLQKSETFRERGVFRIVNDYKLGENTILQEMRFYAESKQIEFDTLLDAREQHRVIKAIFETNIVASTFKNEMQFGYEERPLLKNNSIDAAKFEVCNHKYTDISENGYGMSVLNDCKYGISGSGSVLALTLFKNGTHPDDSGDLGKKRFKYALLPHKGGFGDEVVRQAYTFNNPPFMVEKDDFIKPFVQISADNIICETVKVAEDKSGYVLRLYECTKTRTRAKILFEKQVKAAFCNLLEEEIETCNSKNGELFAEFAPLEIKTIKVYLED